MTRFICLLLLALPVIAQEVPSLPTAEVEELVTTEEVSSMCVVMSVRAGDTEAAKWWMQFADPDEVRFQWAESQAVLSSSTEEQKAAAQAIFAEGAETCAATKADVLKAMNPLEEVEE